MESTSQFWPCHSSIRSDEGLTLETSALKLITVANLDWLNEKRLLIPWGIEIADSKDTFLELRSNLNLYYFIK